MNKVDIKRVVPKLFLAWLVTKMAVLVGCKKEPMPTPQPTPAPTEIPNDSSSNDTNNVVGDTTIPYSGNVVKFYYEGGGVYTPLWKIKEHLALGDSIEMCWSACSGAWTAEGMHRACDSMEIRIMSQDGQSQRITGKGGVVAYEQLPVGCYDWNRKGIAKDDDERFRRMGFDVLYTIPPDTCKNANNPGVGNVIEDKRVAQAATEVKRWRNYNGTGMLVPMRVSH